MFLFSSYFLFSQNEFKSAKISELVRLLRDENKINLYSIKEKKSLSEALIAESIKKHDIKGQLIGLDYLSTSLNNTNELEKFYENSMEGIRLSKLIADEVYENKFVLNIGKFYQDIGEVKESDSIFMHVIQQMASSQNETNIANVSKAFLYLSINQLNTGSANAGLMKYYENKSIEYAFKIKKRFDLRNKCLLNTYSKQIAQLMNGGDFNSAEKLLKIADSISISLADKSYRIGPLMQLGYLNLYKDKPDQALTFYSKAEQISIESNFRTSLKDIYQGLYMSYKAKKDAENALIYLEKLERIGDTINRIERLALIKNLNQLKANKRVEPKKGYYGLLVLSIILVVSLILVILFKNRKAVKVLSNHLPSSEDNSSEEDNVDVLNKHAEKLQELYRIAIEDNEVFFNLYVKAFPDFHENMKHAGMTNSEIEICAMTKLSIDTKQIARIKNLTVRSVESKKYRIRKKLDLNPSDELTSWLLLNT